MPNILPEASGNRHPGVYQIVEQTSGVPEFDVHGILLDREANSKSGGSKPLAQPPGPGKEINKGDGGLQCHTNQSNQSSASGSIRWL
ncbi:MAG: hypothetical protein QM703_14200 [Gemmatales bacterium]